MACGIMVTSATVRRCGFCITPGARDWVKHHNLDWREFITNGIHVEIVESINDGFAIKVAAQARRDAQEKK